MLAAFALAGFGARTVWTGADQRQGVLMLATGAMLLGNEVIWVV